MINVQAHDTQKYHAVRACNIARIEILLAPLQANAMSIRYAHVPAFVDNIP